MFDIITVGSATVDVFVYTDKNQLIDIHGKGEDTQEFLAYPAGSKLLINELHTFSGGGGTNSAVALARMGLKTAFLGVLGEDMNSEKILNELKKEKIRFIGYQEIGMSGYSVILDSIAHDRTILTYKGTNDKLRFDRVNKQLLAAKWFYFSSMMSESYKSLEKLARYAEEHDIKVAFNPSSYLAEQGPGFLKEVLSRTTLLVLNKEEAGLISNKKNITDMLSALRALGPRMVIITNGKEGAHGLFGRDYYFIKAHKIKVVEATGAGDAFASSFAGAMIRGKGITSCLRLGLANAESVLLHPGAKQDLLSWQKLCKSIKSRPAKIIHKRIM